MKLLVAYIKMRQESIQCFYKKPSLEKVRALIEPIWQMVKPDKRWSLVISPIMVEVEPEVDLGFN